MSLFKRKAKVTGGPVEVPGLAELAAAWGMQPVESRPFDGHLEDRVHEVTRVLYGETRDITTFTRVKIGGTSFSHVYRGTVGGRPVTIANAWTDMESDPRWNLNYKGTAVCAVELPTMLMISGIAPREKGRALPGPEAATGNLAFDQRYRVGGASVAGGGAELVTPAVQSAVMAHDDWVFVAERYLFACITIPAFHTSDEVAQRITDVLAVVNAFPAEIVPANVDHSFDDLLARIEGLKSVDEALALLGSLTPEERERVKQSDSPLAPFADVQTPAEAMQRLHELPQDQQLQIMAMFMKVKDQQRRS